MATLAELSEVVTRLAEKNERLSQSVIKLARRVRANDLSNPTIALSRELHALGEVPTARVYRNSLQTISNNTSTAVLFNAELFDNYSMHDLSTNTGRFTVRISGVYLMIGMIAWEADGTGRRTIKIQLNGATGIGEHSISPGTEIEVMQVSCVYNLNIGDYVDLVVVQTSGGDLDVLSSSRVSPDFMIIKVAEAL